MIVSLQKWSWLSSTKLLVREDVRQALRETQLERVGLLTLPMAVLSYRLAMGVWSLHHVNSLQSVFCDRCPGVSHCRECHQKQAGPNSDYCRFLDFRRLVVSCYISSDQVMLG